MYEMKPIFDPTKVHVDLPSCMYKVKNVYDSNLQTSATEPLSNGFHGAVSPPTTKSQPDILQQIQNCLKVSVPSSNLNSNSSIKSLPKIAH